VEIDVSKCLFESMDLFCNWKIHTQTLDLLGNEEHFHAKPSRIEEEKFKQLSK
jgi:hypothetical protein